MKLIAAEVISCYLIFKDLIAYQTTKIISRVIVNNHKCNKSYIVYEHIHLSITA